jgi:hypothetical protein
MKRFASILRMHFNNIKAIINRKLCNAGIGGGIINGWTELEIKHIRNGKVIKKRKIYDRVVTDAFVNHIVDCLTANAGQLALFDDFKYHGSGTGTGSEAAGNTTLGTEVGGRVTGTQVEGASANIYQSVATVTYAGSYAITEHGLFNVSSGGTLMDRTKFAAINVVASDNIQFTFSITLSSGG